jgi:exonuclease VII small subunit
MPAAFSLHEKMSQLETIEEYFQLPNMNLEEAIEKHASALSVAKEVLAYLDKAESTLKKLEFAQISTEL